MKAIEARYGRDGAEQLLVEAGVPANRVYGLNVVYEDSEAASVLGAAARRLTTDELAQAFFDDALSRFPMWFQMCKTSREFLEMQPVIHNTFAHGLQRPEERDAVREKFHLEKLTDELVVHYRSPNRLCDIYRAIAQRVFQHYRETGTIDETKCMKRGDVECELRIRWS
jgi:hypothetical protein